MDEERRHLDRPADPQRRILTIRNHQGDHVRLPADYVSEHVELGYATTAHRAQGRTVDTAHALIDPTTTREILYVGATRGRHINTINVITDHDPDKDTHHGPADEHSAAQVLASILDNTGADTSAHATLHRESEHDLAERRHIEAPEPPRRTSMTAGIYAGGAGIGL